MDSYDSHRVDHAAIAAQLHQPLSDRVPGHHLFLACPAYDQKTFCRVEAQQEMQPLQCFLISPLQIVNQ
ncbi:MAG TPA: hypothetical protein VHR39_22075 [Propionibacteriaceae bacterium]|nr:hypothetical protein [Propionibacteriaceae bacterium]